jgi:predicted RecA/RadA family phage recombinase
VEVTGGSATAAGTSYDNAGATLAATDVQAALDELDAARFLDAPTDGTLYGRRDGGWVEVTGGSATAAGTSYDNAGATLAATDVQAALDELDARTGAPIVAVIAGADADAAVKAATAYVEGSADVETVIAQALADGYRSLVLVGTCTATAAVDIDTADAVEVFTAPNASLSGDLTITGAGSTVRLRATVTGTITDSHARIERPVQGVSVGKIVALTQAEYDALTPDPQTIYYVTDAT